MTLSALALGYAKAGRRVLPLRDDKTPLIKNGSTAASSDHATVAGWWHRWPTALIGMATGGGLVVVDVDVQHGGQLDPTWPLTLTARTRSGGWHLYYYTDMVVSNSVAKVAPGVDIRGEGGYVVAPGSPGWEWVDPTTPIVQMLSSLVSRSHAPARAAFTPKGQVAEGGRNDYIARFTGWVITHELVDPVEVTEFVLQHNDDVCVPPLPEAEVRRTVRSIEQRHACRTDR